MADRTYNLSTADILTYFSVKEGTSPSHKAGYGRIYVKSSDNNIYFKDSSGIESQLNGASNFSPDDYFSIGGDVGSGDVPVFRRCSIDSTGVIDTTASDDIMLNSSQDDSPDQQFIAEKVWNAVWNDVADFQKLYYNEEIVFGKCYYDTSDGLKICNKRCQKSVVGIASNTFGFGLGAGSDNAIPIGVVGWTLAFVDNEYEPGTPLTNTENGTLTEMTLQEKRDYPERLVAIYKKIENKQKWGVPGKEINVNGRHWVKIK